MNSFSAIPSTPFKLSNGLLVDKSHLENEIGKICHYVSQVVIAKQNEDGLVALIFPDKALFSQPDYHKSPDEGCFCPRNLREFGQCFLGCVQMINATLGKGYAKVAAAVVIDDTLPEAETTGDTTARNDDLIIKKYKGHLDNLFGGHISVKERSYNLWF